MSGSEKTQILLASNNSGKLVELNLILNQVGLEAVSISQVVSLKNLPQPEESGETFEANALLKAEYYARNWPGPVLADDSGLEITALDNQPGVKSNRWLLGSDLDRNKAVLTRLLDKPDRSARFVSVICWLENSIAKPVYFRGEMEGVIGSEMAGTAGFGYDPIFIPIGFDKSLAQLGLELKNRMSHRAKAMTKLLKFLQARS